MVNVKLRLGLGTDDCDEASRLCFVPRDSGDLAEKLRALLDMDPASRASLGARLRAIVARDHEVEALMARLVRLMERPK